MAPKQSGWCPAGHPASRVCTLSKPLTSGQDAAGNLLETCLRPHVLNTLRRSAGAAVSRAAAERVAGGAHVRRRCRGEPAPACICLIACAEPATSLHATYALASFRHWHWQIALLMSLCAHAGRHPYCALLDQPRCAVGDVPYPWASVLCRQPPPSYSLAPPQ